MRRDLSRRDFLKRSAAFMLTGAAAQAGDAPSGSAATAPSPLARRPLGKTGAMVSILGFGAGSRFCSIEDEEAALVLLDRAFDLGINYFDTASAYTRRGVERLSERRIGQFSKRRRKEVFLATKFDPRDRDGALRSVERSLQLLQTDYVDLIQIHSLTGLDDLNRMEGPNGAIAALGALKDQKMARFISITGHNDGAALAEALRRYDFDAVLMALNPAQAANPVAARSMEALPEFEDYALPVAREKQIGVISMKVMAQGRIAGEGAGKARAPDLLRFNLSLPIACAVIGLEQRARLEENVRVARAFLPMNESDKQKLRDHVAPSRSAWQRYLQSHDDSLPV